MRQSIATKAASLFLSSTLVMSSMPGRSMSAPATAMPDFVKAFTPATQLGFIDSYYQGNTQHPVILIQDLHANYGVQKKIVGLLEFMQPKAAPTGRSMVLGIEGAWGDIDLSAIRSEPEKIRRPTADFLLEKSEISAMEHFAVLSEAPVQLVGIDDPADYILHTELFRKSLAARLSLAQKTDQLRLAINESKGDAPVALRKLWKMEDVFHAGQMDLATLSKKLGVALTNYKEAEQALAQAKNDLVNMQEGQTKFFLNNVVEADQNLALLGRLLRQQLVLEEVQYASKRVPAMLVTVRALLPGENMELWSDTIRSAIDHYAVALLRDKPMGEHALELSRKYADTSVVIVAGGFHTAGISDILKAHKISHIVIAPVVESHTTKDEEVYVQRMLDIHVTDAEIVSSLASPKSDSAVSFMGAAIASQLGQKIYPFASHVWSVTSNYVRTSRIVRTAPDVMARVKAIRNLIQVPELKVPGLFARVGNGLRRLTGQVQEIDIPTTTAADAASVSLVNSMGGIGKIKKVTAFTAAFIGVSIAAAAQSAVNNPAAQKVAQTGVDSSTLVEAGLALVATAGAAWAFGPKKNRDANVRRARELINGAA